MATNPSKPKQLYDQQKRGAKAPVYTPAESKYRSEILSHLHTAYFVREQPHMELDDKTYSEYYLINRQQDMAYNPPKRSAADVRLNSGIIHEKDSTIQSIITQMNFQPKVRVHERDGHELHEASAVFTAKLKKSLIQDNFKDKLREFVRIMISQGDVYVDNYRDQRFQAKKIPLNKTDDPTKKKWKTVVEKEDLGCTSEARPNDGLYFANIQEKNVRKQPRIWYVVHMPVIQVAQMYKDFPRWENVPKSPSQTIPTNVDGLWGDYFLQQPTDDYCEVIMTQSEADNDFNIFINGVMMYPVQEENGVITGYPLTEVSPSGRYTIVAGHAEPIPFFAYSRSEPSKNEVKEESMNELLRLMFYKLRQSAKPPVGNNSDRVLPSNIWDPGVITPDIRKEDISVLTPNVGVQTADFSFYQLLSQSISDSTVSASVEGTNQTPDVTATQYVDQKKENLKKLGLLLDNTIEFLREIYWLRLYNELSYITEKKAYFDPSNQGFIDAYADFAVEENIDGKKGTTQIKFVDDTNAYTDEDTLNQQFQQEELGGDNKRTFYVRPDYVADLIKNLKDYIYIDVVSEPEGEQLALLGNLFNLLTQYVNLKGGDATDINFEYLQKVIDQNSGFETDKIFLKAKPQMDPVMAAQMGLSPQAGIQGNGGTASVRPQNPSAPMNTQQNSILANAK